MNKSRNTNDMENYEQKYKEFQTAKERAEQHSFPFIAMFDDIVEKQYNDLKSNYTKEHEELFCKNIDFLLKYMIMDYEKAYKEALERAKDLHDTHPYGEPPVWTTCEKIFPELKESEDERG